MLLKSLREELTQSLQGKLLKLCWQCKGSEESGGGDY